MVTSGLRRGETIRIRGERWTVARRVDGLTGDILEVRGCDRANRGTRARFLLPFERFDRVAAPGAPQIVRRRRWRYLARTALAGASPPLSSLQSAASAAIDVLPFQLEPALAAVRGAAARILIADEVGLGKTVQAGLIVAETLARDPDAHVLVLVPASLREQWAGELQQRFHVCPSVVDSAMLARSDAAGARTNPWCAHPLIVASIDYVKRPEVLRALEAMVWDLVVIDEAHALAGRSERHAAAALIGERARTLVLLTATPHSGDEEGFARLCGIGDGGNQFPLLVFRRTRADAGLPSARRTSTLGVRPTTAERAMHERLMEYARLGWKRCGGNTAARLAMLVLVRRACSSATSLLRSVERRLELLAGTDDAAAQLALPLFASPDDDEEPDGVLAAPALADPVDERGRLQDIATLARRASIDESKMGAVRRLLRRSGEPAVVFTEYRDTLATLARELQGFAVAQLHGGLSPAERAAALDAFSAGTVSVLVATDTASEGLNLHHHCRLVVHLELPWTPTKLEQRTGRVDRIGQRRRVHDVRLLGRGTNEAIVVAPIVASRTRAASQALDALRAQAGCEREIADSVFAPASGYAADVAPRALPNGLAAGDMRAAARAEAARVVDAQALLTAASTADSRRPFAAAMDLTCGRGFTVSRMSFEDVDENLVFEAVVGVGYFLATEQQFRRAGDVRQHVGQIGEPLSACLGEERQAVLEELRRFLDEALQVPVERERAILAAIGARRARLVGAVVQQGLFDRRAERETAARRGTLEEALGRCDRHLGRLTARLRVRPCAVEPVFTVLLR